MRCKIALLFDQNADILAEQLRDKGYVIAGIDSSLEEIARQNDTQVDEIISFIGSR